MTRGRALLFWLALLVAAPVPVFGVASGRLPPLHLLELGGLSLAFTLLERAHGIGLLLSALLLGQALAWSAALWVLASLLARALRSLPLLTGRRVTLLLIALGLGLAAAKPIYVTPYSARSSHSALLDVYR